jgi:hypothetical protein
MKGERRAKKNEIPENNFLEVKWSKTVKYVQNI